MRRIGKSHILLWSIGLLLIAGIGLRYRPMIQTAYYQIDEFEFVRKGFFYTLFVHRDVTDHRWFDLTNDPAQPKVGPYIYGFALTHLGQASFEQSFASYERYKQGRTNSWQEWLWKNPSHLAPEVRQALPVVQQGRSVALLFFLMGLVAFLCIGAALGGYHLSYIIILMLGTNRLIASHTIYAMTDMFLLCFFSWGLYGAFSFPRHIQRKKWPFLLVSIFFGILSTLATGVKVTGILLPIFFGLLYGYAFFIYRDKRLLIISSCLLFLGTFLLSFISLHPYLYSNTFQHFLTMFTYRLDAAAFYQTLYPSTSVTSRWQAIALLFERVLLPSNNYGNISLPFIPTDYLLFLTGVIALGSEVWKKKKMIRKEGITLLWVGTILLGFIVYLKNDWPRYYLPAVVGITLIEAYGLIALIKKTYSLSRNFSFFQIGRQKR